MGRHNRDEPGDEPDPEDTATGGIDVRVVHARRRATQVALAGAIEPPTAGLPVPPPRASAGPHRHRPSRAHTSVAGRHRRPTSGRHCR